MRRRRRAKGGHKNKWEKPRAVFVIGKF